MLKSKFFVVVLAFIFVLSSLATPVANASGSFFTDINLEQAVMDSLEVNELDENSFADFIELHGSDYRIDSLEGLETYGTNLEFVLLDSNNISDLTPLTNLKQIQHLELSLNNIENIKPLSGLNETFLSLGYNNISDISAFKGWTSGMVDLSGNNITDITPLKDMKEGMVFLFENPLNEKSLELIKQLEKNEDLMIIHDGSKFSERLSGKSRFETAVEISMTGWYEADTVVLANGLNFPDALAGGPLAYAIDAPILLTRPETLHAATQEEILRLGARKVVILGGKAAVSEKVENQLKALDIKIDRINGADRYETAKKIADRLGSQHDEVVVVSGKNFPDALSIAPYAALNELPILLVAPDKVPASTKTVLSKATKTLVIGGHAAIGKSLEKEFANHTRISGANRYETAANVMEELEMDPIHVFVANGRGFADALTGSVLAGYYGSPLLLVNPDEAPEATMLAVEKYNINSFTILGGEASVPEFVVDQLLRD
ncbi:cell wall-binding repeat-containing protein [Sutcliffiella horikoshii]|uniref:cell wall-binding repeat-containing protein n=1 Tax=Sutcliffiella horikoshii TaxID=79883 RepID=UPI003CF711CE